MSLHVPIPKVGTLVSVWAALIVLTGLTSAASYIDVGEWNIVLALLIAITKASLVVWIFMGVRHVTTLTRLFVVAGLVWLFQGHSSRARHPIFLAHGWWALLLLSPAG